MYENNLQYSGKFKDGPKKQFCSSDPLRPLRGITQAGIQATCTWQLGDSCRESCRSDICVASSHAGLGALVKNCFDTLQCCFSGDEP